MRAIWVKRRRLSGIGIPIMNINYRSSQAVTYILETKQNQTTRTYFFA